MNPRETIESTLRQVQLGVLSPSEATRRLLAVQEEEEEEEVRSPETDRGESLASLVRRLGTPPSDIVEGWCGQLSRISNELERETGESPPMIDLNEWSLTSEGDLLFNGRRYKTSGQATSPSPIAVDHINRFRAALNPGSPGSPEDPPVDETRATPIRTITYDPAKPHPAEHGQPIGRSRPTRAARAMFVIALLACLGVAVAILDNASRPKLGQHEMVTSASNAAPAAQSPAVEAKVLDSLDSLEAAGTLETFESMTEAELSSLEAEATETANSFSLDDLMPPVARYVPTDDLIHEGSDSESKSAEMETDAASQATTLQPMSDSIERPLGVEDASPAESPQQTRSSKAMSVELPGIDETVDATRLSENVFREVNLEFPFEVPLTIAPNELGWTIRDSRKEIAVAAISSDETGTSLQWTAEAGESASANSLLHGRITERDGGTVFLRPIVEADPWPIRVDQSDVMPSWDLHYPIPPRVARISVELDVPEKIELGWMEVVEPDSLRRARGLAVLSRKDSETVSLGLRLDLQCGKKVSCRVRFAGRLDPSMPWQVVSTPMLEMFADQLAQQATMISKEETRLAAVYEMAGTSGRRILRIKRDRNDAHGEIVRTTSQRVAQLQTMIAMLEAEGSLRIRVWVEWPDTQQDLLVMRTAQN